MCNVPTCFFDIDVREQSLTSSSLFHYQYIQVPLHPIRNSLYRNKIKAIQLIKQVNN